MNDDSIAAEQSSSSPQQDISSNNDRSVADPSKVRVSIDLDSEILERIEHLTKDPSKIIETAIVQWLNGERDGDTDLTRTFRRNPPIPPQGEWND